MHTNDPITNTISQRLSQSRNVSKRSQNKNSIVYINARSIHRNLEKIELLSNNLKPKIICCSEARVTKEIENEIDLQGYNNLICLSDSRKTGGVAFYIKKDLKYKVIHTIAIKDTFWGLSLEILESNLNGIYSCFYRANKANNNIFENIFEEFLAKTINFNKIYICVGDLNINLNETNSKTKLFNKICSRFGIKNRVNFDTRITNTSKTKIDVVLTNDIKIINCYIINEERISDHETIGISILHNNNINKKEIKTVYSWKYYNKKQLIDNLRNSEWQNFEILNLDEKINLLKTNLENSVKPMLQLVTIRDRINPKRWFDTELKELKEKKIQKHDCWKRDEGNSIKWNEYKNVRNKYNDLVKKKKENSIKYEIKQSGQNQKKIWKCLNKVLPPKNCTINDEIQFNEIKTTDPKEICNKFNEYFIKSITDLNAEIPMQNHQINNTARQCRFEFRMINAEEMCQITQKLTKKINKSQICNSMVWNDSMEYIAYHMCLIINESLESGCFPNEWKTATVTPIPKKPNTNKANEFRPINSMLCEEKMIEMAVKEQLLEYLENNNILTENQSAYRKLHSCETALNFLITECKEGLEKYFIIVVFLDLKRAFETVDRERMIQKLKNYGVGGYELKWFESYMQKRKQIVQYKNEKSKEKEIPIGLAQGTQLSVILFLIYINDLVNVAKSGKILLFADDAVHITKCKNVNEGIQKANEDLENIYKWMNANKLKLNIDKTKWMLMSKKTVKCNQNSIKIGGEFIERVQNIKYLGFNINEKLSLDKQMKNTTKKVAYKTNFLFRINKKLTFNTKKMIYNSIILPHFDFCSTLYIGHTQAQLKSLQKLQNRSLRIILNCEFGTSTKFMLEALNFMSVKQRWTFNTIMFIFKIKNDLTPRYLRNKLQYNNETHDVNTRNRNELRLPDINSELARSTIFYNGIKMFNEMPPVLRNEKSIRKFKTLLDKYIREKISIK